MKDGREMKKENNLIIPTGFDLTFFSLHDSLQKLKNSKEWKGDLLKTRRGKIFWILIAFTLAILTVGIPYLFLRDIESFWGSYFYWIVLTLSVMVLVWWKASKWRSLE